METVTINEVYEALSNIQTIFYSLSKEELIVVCYLISFNTFLILFFPKIVFWIIRVFKRLIKFIYYLLKRKDDNNEISNR